MTNKLHFLYFFAFLLLLTVATSCRDDQLVVPTEYEDVGDSDPDAKVVGMYLLNEGNMGSNKCTLDYYDFITGVYQRNFYSERNPGVIKELGDVGNDIGIYGSKLYAVINCSHKVEVMDAHTGLRLGQVDIPNCRSLLFVGGKAYVSAYVAPVQPDPKAPRGAVFEVDTATLQITRQVTVGYQPEEMAVVGGYMYVANSGGYRAPNYDNTLSVIDMRTFKVVDAIEVDINLDLVRDDADGRVWVTSRGNRKQIPPRLYLLERPQGSEMLAVKRCYDIAVSAMAMHGRRLYYFGTTWSDYTQSTTINYGVIDLDTLEPTGDNFITDGTEIEITMPYGIAVNPDTGDIYITDAKNYVSSGMLHCYDPEGRRKWSVRTGDIPAHITFLIR